jgi:hypothetical protein
LRVKIKNNNGVKRTVILAGFGTGPEVLPVVRASFEIISREINLSFTFHVKPRPPLVVAVISYVSRETES